MVDAQMKNNNQKVPEKKLCHPQIDTDTWLELSGLCTRIVGTFGIIEPILDLAEDKGDAEKLRRLRLIKYLSQTGSGALKKFARLWTELHEQIRRDELQNQTQEFEDILQEARTSTVGAGTTATVNATLDKE
jgi:hypothetical protein